MAQLIVERKLFRGPLRALKPWFGMGEENDNNSGFQIQVFNALKEGDYDTCQKLFKQYPPEILKNSENKHLAALLEDVLRQRTSIISELRETVFFSIQLNESAIEAAKTFADARKINEMTQNIAGASEEMSANIREMNITVTEVAREASEATTAAMEGINSASDSREAMKAISESIQISMNHLQGLQGSSKNIEKILGKIEDIADQTKLLALNATIEAARAGEVGKGFAVVAQEVKSLSKNTEEESNVIKREIEALLQEINSIQKALEESTKAAETGVASTENTRKTIEALQLRNENVSEKIQNISNALSEQAKASEEISENIHAVAASTKSILDGVTSMCDSNDRIQESICTKIIQLCNNKLSGLIILKAQSDHVVWKKKLVDMFSGRAGLNENELADNHKCALGKWFFEISDPKYKSHQAYKNLADPHQKVHAHGIKAVTLCNQGKRAEAMEEFKKMEEASVNVMKYLKELESVELTVEKKKEK